MFFKIEFCFYCALFGVLCLFWVERVSAQAHPPFVGVDFQGLACEGFSGGYGPFDYLLRSRYSKELKLVEDYHFTREVESLNKGSTNMRPYPDIEYTLRAWPNHHRALNAMARLEERKRAKRRGNPIPAECWFQRAINFSPKDATSKMLFGNYLSRFGRDNDAEEMYRAALVISPADLEIRYNLALLLVRQGRFEEAREQAKVAYRGGYPLPGLRRKLEEAGYWP